MMEFTAALEFRISSQHRLPTYEEWHVLSGWKPYRIFVMLEPIHEYFTEFILSFECLTPMWSEIQSGYPQQHHWQSFGLQHQSGSLPASFPV